jgi:hypothetical protein
MRSVCIALPQNLKKRLDQDLDIKPKAPIVDVPKIELYALGYILNRQHRSTRAIALSPTCHAWFHMVSVRILTQDRLEMIVVCHRMRARTNQRHIALQYIQ